uniref:Uncharacterized protein n=1 Tax=Rhizophora mucronata TaxID=61149 RepID=A0A2P2N9L2_RHIMU
MSNCVGYMDLFLHPALINTWLRSPIIVHSSIFEFTIYAKKFLNSCQSAKTKITLEKLRIGICSEDTHTSNIHSDSTEKKTSSIIHKI